MNQITSPQVGNRGKNRRHRRLAGASVVAVAAAAALVVGIAPTGHSPLSTRAASAAVAIRSIADAQRALPDQAPDLRDVSPAIAALEPTMRDFPAGAQPAAVWSWLDAHCAPARAAMIPDDGASVGDAAAQAAGNEASFIEHKDCGLLGTFVFLQLASPAQRATLLDALASLPGIAAVDGRKCAPGGGVNTKLGPTKEFRVTRNGTETVLSITHTNTVRGGVLIGMLLWNEAVSTPCPTAG
jgi:hypothetical protein